MSHQVSCPIKLHLPKSSEEKKYLVMTLMCNKKCDLCQKRTWRCLRAKQLNLFHVKKSVLVYLQILIGPHYKFSV